MKAQEFGYKIYNKFGYDAPVDILPDRNKTQNTNLPKLIGQMNGKPLYRSDSGIVVDKYFMVVNEVRVDGGKKLQISIDKSSYSTGGLVEDEDRYTVNVAATGPAMVSNVEMYSLEQFEKDGMKVTRIYRKPKPVYGYDKTENERFFRELKEFEKPVYETAENIDITDMERVLEIMKLVSGNRDLKVG